MIYFLTGVKNSRRIIDIKAAEENFVTSMNFCNASDELFLESIIEFHSVARCDTVSIFSSWGKEKPLKLMTKSFCYIEAFFKFGKKITIADSLVGKLEMFVCHIYGTARYYNTVRYYC